jgi:hypothetical protein
MRRNWGSILFWRLTLQPTQPLSTVSQGAISAKIKPGRDETDYLPPSSNKVKNTSIPAKISTSWFLIKLKEYCIVTYTGYVCGSVTNNTTRVGIGYRIYSLWRFITTQITITMRTTSHWSLLTPETNWLRPLPTSNSLTVAYCLPNRKHSTFPLLVAMQLTCSQQYLLASVSM